MTALLASWMLFPVVMAAIALGCGLLVERLSGLRLPGALVLPLGLATVVVVANVATMLDETAEFATPLIVALACAGIGLAYPGRGRRVDWWAVAAAVAVFAVYAAPIVLSGDATFAGYLTLDDTATWLALADHVLDHGRTVSGLAASTHETVLHDYLDGGVPLGAFLPLGVGGRLTGQDLAWLFQPTIAFYGAMLSLAIYAAVERLVASRAIRAAVAFTGSQAALLFAYAFWSGIKEVAAAAMLALVAIVVATTMARWSGVRTYVPSAVAVAALLAVLGLIGGVWLIVPAAAVAVLLTREGPRSLARAAAVLGALVVVLALPSIVIARTFISGATGNELTEGNGVANLGHPLDTLQVFGIWPATDFRTRPHDETVAYVLIGVLIAAAVAGVLMAWRRRAWGVPLYLAAAGGGLLLVFALERNGLGSPWLNAKAMAIASPAVVAAAAAGVAAVFETGRRVEAIVAAGAIFAGVAWSNALVYSNVWLAPRTQLAELEQIGERYAGAGPTLMTEYQPNGVRHFLRKLDAEAASERRRRQVDLRRGGVLDPGSSADLDEFTQAAVFTYPTLVLRRSPVASRPPSVYDLVWKGRWYEVWQMRAGAPEVLEHASLGNALDPRGVSPCSEVRRLGRAAQQAGGLVASVARREPIYVDLSRAAFPPRWNADESAPGILVPHGGGVVSLEVEVPRAGSYSLWLGGSFRRTVTAVVDGRRVGAVTHQLNNDGQWTSLGTVRLDTGRHAVELRYGGSRLTPGSGGLALGMGPLMLSTTTADLPVTYVTPARARSLCGKRLDWLEAIAS